MGKKLKIRGKHLLDLGYPQGPAIGMAINMMLKHYKRHSHEEVMALLKDVLEQQSNYTNDPVLGEFLI